MTAMQLTEGAAVKMSGDRAVVLARTFNAPLRLVFDAHTRPELVRRWLLGPPGWTMPVCEIDLHVGGRIRYVWRGTDGSGMGTAKSSHPAVSSIRRSSTRTGAAARCW